MIAAGWTIERRYAFHRRCETFIFDRAYRRRNVDVYLGFRRTA